MSEIFLMTLTFVKVKCENQTVLQYYVVFLKILVAFFNQNSNFFKIVLSLYYYK